MQLFSVSYLFIYSPLEAVALVLSESSVSQSDCRVHVTCKIRPLFSLLSKSKGLDCASKFVEQKLKGCG